MWVSKQRWLMLQVEGEGKKEERAGPAEGWLIWRQAEAVTGSKGDRMRPASVHQSATASGNIPAVSTASPPRSPSRRLCRRLRLFSVAIHARHSAVPFCCLFVAAWKCSLPLWRCFTTVLHTAHVPRWPHPYRLAPGTPPAPRTCDVDAPVKPTAPLWCSSRPAQHLHRPGMTRVETEA